MYVSIITSACTSPYQGYQGEYPELLTVAMNTLLGAFGYYEAASSDKMERDSRIEILDEDDYGRILFAYNEYSNISSLSLLIMQQKDDTYVYFYPNYCFISYDVRISIWENNFGEIALNYFSEEDIQALKDKNDWDQEVNESKCVKAQITRIKIQPEIKLDKKDFEPLFKKLAKDTGYNGSDTIVRYAFYCTSDTYGRMLYYAWGVGRNVNPYRRFDVAIIINLDGSYDEETCIMELSDLFNYQDELKALKDLNSWNQPLES